jgi:uncharacterized membrane protein
MSRSLSGTDDLLVVLAWTLFAGTAVFVGFTGTLRILLALPLVVLLPGYALLAALYPERRGTDLDSDGGTSLSGVERFGLSVVASLALVPMVAFVVNYTAGIHLRPLLLAVVGLTVALTVVGYVRRVRVPVDRRYRVPLGRWLASQRERFFSRGRRTLERAPPLKPTSGTQGALNLLFALSLVVLAATAGYAAVNPPQDDEPFSEFYLLTQGADGEFRSENLPREYTAGESRELFVAVGNHEGQAVPYTVVVKLGGTELDRFGRTVDAGETRRFQYAVTPEQTGDRLRLSFLLYRGDVPANPTPENAYRETHLWVSVGG